VSHTALARRYRPRRFSEVATQEHVSETLRRAVSGDRVGHAYLFCGPRGVGKTTLARVLAMALNCGSRSPDGEPCGECESCRRIWAGSTALDVVEIDAASNRGVDDARELRSRAMYAPSEEGRFKVYIVDEAHMLTREAWNALLKVLEEPPPRVIFIFATTEPEKIEQTAAPILSRCQRFDFRRVGVPEIVDRLREVLEAEGAGAADDALRLIARKADGGMRDALSLTDQVLSLSDGNEIQLETVRRILGVVEEERFLEVMDLLANRDRAGLFRVVEELLDQGYDLVEFYQGLVDALRTLLRIRVGGELNELPPERRGDWEARAAAFGPGDLVRMLEMAAQLETGGSLRRSAQPRVLLELLLLRFSYLDRTVEMEALLSALGGEGDRGSLHAAEESAAAGGSDLRGGSGEGADSGGRTTGRPDERTEAEPAPGERAGAEGPPPAGEAPDATRLEAGWKALLESGEGIPPGLTPFLMGADVRVAEEGLLRIELPAGPALERLSLPEERERLARALAGKVGGAPVRIEIVEATSSSGSNEDRISREEVRSDQLGDLLEKEPGLREAVEGWDLEIVD
jgi:DNA polymerase III subunit gamma/tau